jgi:hypothetical protein
MWTNRLNIRVATEKLEVELIELVIVGAARNRAGGAARLLGTRQGG